MVKTCFVDTCKGSNRGSDVKYFKFPTCKQLRAKWQKAMRTQRNLTKTALLCSSHFLPTDYKVVKGERVLKSRAVPSVFEFDSKPTRSTRSTRNAARLTKTLEEESKTDNDEEGSQDDDDDDDDDGDDEMTDRGDGSTPGDVSKSSLTADAAVNMDGSESEETNSCNKMSSLSEDNVKKWIENESCSQQTDKQTDMDVIESADSSKAAETDISSLAAEKADDNKEVEGGSDNKDEINNDSTNVAESSDKINEINRNSTAVVENTDKNNAKGEGAENCDANNSIGANPDHKTENNKDNGEEITKEKENNEEITDLNEMETGLNEKTGEMCQINNSNEIQVDENGRVMEREPVFIEIPTEPMSSSSDSGASPTDCVMIVERVQVDVDPATLLMHPDDDEDEEDPDLEERKEEPVSLLTSSDDDDVIIEEPEIDLVEVSDATDDDDVPLTRLVESDKRSGNRPSDKKSDDLSEDKLSEIFWGAKNYFCYICSYTADSRTKMKEHKKVHENEVMYVCEHCTFQTPNRGQFSRHKRRHKDEKKYFCHLCDYKAIHKMSLVYHLKSHKEISDLRVFHKYRCKKCTFRSNEKIFIERHQRNVHGSSVFYCSACDYSTKNKGVLTRHEATHLSDQDDNDHDYVPGQD